jgi:tetratricopeptide (TPR) repeat protein
VYFQEGRFEDALQKFSTALQVLGYNPHLSYNVALCYYRLKEYAPALKHICKDVAPALFSTLHHNLEPTITFMGTQQMIKFRECFVPFSSELSVFQSAV